MGIREKLKEARIPVARAARQMGLHSTQLYRVMQREGTPAASQRDEDLLKELYKLCATNSVATSAVPPASPNAKPFSSPVEPRVEALIACVAQHLGVVNSTGLGESPVAVSAKRLSTALAAVLDGLSQEEMARVLRQASGVDHISG